MRLAPWCNWQHAWLWTNYQPYRLVLNPHKTAAFLAAEKKAGLIAENDVDVSLKMIWRNQHRNERRYCSVSYFSSSVWNRG